MAEKTELAPGQALVDIVSTSIESEVRTTTIRVLAGQMPGPPITPGALYQQSPWRSVLDLHRVVEVIAATATFETYGATEAPRPGEYILQSWWSPDAYALVADTSRRWVEAPYARDGEADRLRDSGPDFCVLTYEALVPGEAAYTDGKGSWISQAAFATFIAADVLRIRQGSPSSSDIAAR